MNESRVDSRKRGRLALLAFFVAASTFVLRSFSFIDVDNALHITVTGLIYFVSTYALLILALNFQVNKRSLFVVIPQSAIFVMTEVLFIMLFFLRDFERIYEFLVLIFLLFFIFTGAYVSFLMSNIFNVSAFRQIPLIQVAKTTSYIITLLSIYFWTFIILSLQLNIILIMILLALGYAVITYFHLVHLSLAVAEKYYIVGLSTVSMLSLALSTMFLGSRYELSALLPVVTALILLGLEMNRSKTQNNWIFGIQYFLLFIAVLAANILFQ